MTPAGTASQSRVAAVTRRGHQLKIAEAIEALRREGNLPRHPRPVERDRRIVEWLAAHGYAADLPSRSAIGRYFGAADASEQIGRNGQCEA
jgi:hypothetical protein